LYRKKLQKFYVEECALILQNKNIHIVIFQDKVRTENYRDFMCKNVHYICYIIGQSSYRKFMY